MTAELAQPSAERTPDALTERLFEAGLGMFELMSVYVGDRLGLYRALRDGGPASAADLAGRAGIDGRSAREWLEQQAAAGFLDVDDVAAEPGDRRFTLPGGHVAPLLDPDSPYSIAPLARSIVACARALPLLLEAYRTGGGLDWAAYGSDMIEGQGDLNRPWLVGSFGTEMLPAIADVHARLIADRPARVADVACGVGWAAISIARAYPNVRVDGFDLDPSSIALARQNAAAAGLDHRVTFDVRDAADPAAVGQYDVAVVIEAIHDLSRPVEALTAIRRMLKPDGVALIADEKTEDAFTAPAGMVERMYYGFSLMTCLPAAMTERPTAATGTLLRPAAMKQLAAEAGFRTVDVLAEPALDMLRFYRLKP